MRSGFPVVVRFSDEGAEQVAFVRIPVVLTDTLAFNKFCWGNWKAISTRTRHEKFHTYDEVCCGPILVDEWRIRQAIADCGKHVLPTISCQHQRIVISK